MGWFTDNILGLDDSGGIVGSVETVATNPLKSFRNAKERIVDDIAGLDDSGGTLGSVIAFGENIEDSLREGIEDVDAALQNKYVRATIKLVSQVSPDPFTRATAAFLDAYATADSGDDLSAAQIVNLATSTAAAYQASQAPSTELDESLQFDEGDIAGTPADPTALDEAAKFATNETVGKIANVGAQVADGAEFSDAVFNVFQQDLVAGLVGDVAEGTVLTEKDAEALANTIIDYSESGELSTAIADNLGDFVAKYQFGLPTDVEGPYTQDTTNKIAAVKAGLQGISSIDQAEAVGDVIFNAASTYFTEEGELDLPKIADADIPGFDLPEVDIDLPLPDALKDLVDFDLTLPNIGLPAFTGIPVSLGELAGDLDIIETSFTLPDIPEMTVNIPKIPIGFPETALDLPKVDVDIPKVDVELPKVDVEIPKVDVEIPKVDLPKVDVEIPKVDKPDFEGPDIEEPDISKPTLDLMQFAGLLSLTGGGKAPAEEEQAGSQYQTKFNFLAGLEPLGMLGSFQKRA
jgi:hypothetical protein